MWYAGRTIPRSQHHPEQSGCQNYSYEQWRRWPSPQKNGILISQLARRLKLVLSQNWTIVAIRPVQKGFKKQFLTSRGSAEIRPSWPNKRKRSEMPWRWHLQIVMEQTPLSPLFQSLFWRSIRERSCKIFWAHTKRKKNNTDETDLDCVYNWVLKEVHICQLWCNA